jgi:hypothetical protein
LSNGFEISEAGPSLGSTLRRAYFDYAQYCAGLRSAGRLTTGRYEGTGRQMRRAALRSDAWFDSFDSAPFDFAPFDFAQGWQDWYAHHGLLRESLILRTSLPGLRTKLNEV